MTEETAIHLPEKQDVDATIRHHIYAAMGIGLVPIPVLDFIGFSAVQVDLIRALSTQYGVPFKATQAKAIIGALIGGGTAVAGSSLFASFIKCVPLIGYTAGATSSSIIGGSVTYAIGRLISRHLEKGGTLDTFNTEEAKEAFEEVTKEGKEVATKLAKEAQTATKKATEKVAAKTRTASSAKKTAPKKTNTDEKES